MKEGGEEVIGFIFGFDITCSKGFKAKTVIASQKYLKWIAKGQGFDKLKTIEAVYVGVDYFEIFEKVEKLKDIGCDIEINPKTKQHKCEIIIKEVTK